MFLEGGAGLEIKLLQPCLQPRALDVTALPSFYTPLIHIDPCNTKMNYFLFWYTDEAVLAAGSAWIILWTHEHKMNLGPLLP